ncbi:hypothetical protein F5Y18DRAFT_434883 [Xylariaceae sp. FL1019]|nr:hypothetical protein F5Y18DRAFT_434883 [Xylariaceae sp. FL1019]
MEVLGSVAAIVQLTGLLVNTTTNLRRYVDSIRKAPEEVEYFMLETSNFIGLLHSFSRTTKGYLQTLDAQRMKETETLVWNIERQCTHVLDGIEDLTSRFEELARGNIHPIQKLLNGIKFIFDKPDVSKLKLDLQLALLIVQSLTSQFSLELILKGNESFTLEVQMLRKQLRNLKPMTQRVTQKLVIHRQKYDSLYDDETANETIEMSRQINNRAVRVVKSIPPPTAVAQEQSVDDSASLRRKPPVDKHATGHGPDWPGPLVLRPGSVSRNVSNGQRTSGPPTRKSREVVDRTVNREQRYVRPQDSPSGRTWALDITDPMRPRIYPKQVPGDSEDETNGDDEVEESQPEGSQSNPTEYHLPPGEADAESIVSELGEPLVESSSSVHERIRHPWGPSGPGSMVGAPTTSASEPTPKVKLPTASERRDPSEIDQRRTGIRATSDSPRKQPPSPAPGYESCSSPGCGCKSARTSNIPDPREDQNTVSESEEDPPSPYVPMPPFDENDKKKFDAKRRRPRRPKPKFPG